MSTPPSSQLEVQRLVISLEQAATTVDASAIPTLLGELERIRVALWIRTLAPPRAVSTHPEVPLDGLRHITPAQVADLLGLKEPYVHELCRTRRLPAVKHGKYWLVAVTALRDWLASQARDVDPQRAAGLLSRDAPLTAAAHPHLERRDSAAIRRRARLAPRRVRAPAVTPPPPHAGS